MSLTNQLHLRQIPFDIGKTDVEEKNSEVRVGVRATNLIDPMMKVKILSVCNS